MTDDAVDRFREELMELIGVGAPVDALVRKLNRFVGDDPLTRARVRDDLERTRHALWAESQWSPAQLLERVLEAFDKRE